MFFNSFFLGPWNELIIILIILTILIIGMAFALNWILHMDFHGWIAGAALFINLFLLVILLIVLRALYYAITNFLTSRRGQDPDNDGDPENDENDTGGGMDGNSSSERGPSHSRRAHLWQYLRIGPNSLDKSSSGNFPHHRQKLLRKFVHNMSQRLCSVRRALYQAVSYLGELVVTFFPFVDLFGYSGNLFLRSLILGYETLDVIVRSFFFGDFDPVIDEITNFVDIWNAQTLELNGNQQNPTLSESSTEGGSGVRKEIIENPPSFLESSSTSYGDTSEASSTLERICDTHSSEMPQTREVISIEEKYEVPTGGDVECEELKQDTSEMENMEAASSESNPPHTQ